MSALPKTGDADRLLLGHQPWAPRSSQFLEHAQRLGIKMPDHLPLPALAAKGWLRPRLRIALPPAAISACWNAYCDPTGSPDNDPADAWAHQLLAQCGSSSAPLLPTEVPWIHWLESATEPGRMARTHAVDLDEPTKTPAPVPHPLVPDTRILPVVDFYADWQAYHLAELLDRARFDHFVVTGEADHFVELCRAHAERFDRRAQTLVQRWREIETTFTWLARYRTIWAHNARSVDDFDERMRRDTQAWAAVDGITGDVVSDLLADPLLVLWRDWQERPPLDSNRLRIGLRMDIALVRPLYRHLTGSDIDPFDAKWYWRDGARGLRSGARLVDALKVEEWRAPDAFVDKAQAHAGDLPSVFRHSRASLARLVRAHWANCSPLRRFCLAWVRLMRNRLQDDHRHADALIAADESIEQLNLVALHTERLLRHVASVLATGTAKQDGSNKVMRAAAQRSIALASPSAAVPDKLIEDLLEQQTKLHTMPDLAQRLCQPPTVASGDQAADQLIAAHVNALIARNYAAHHDYLDDKLISSTGAKGSDPPARTFLFSCLLVVVAALHSLPKSPTAGTP